MGFNSGFKGLIMQIQKQRSKDVTLYNHGQHECEFESDTQNLSYALTLRHKWENNIKMDLREIGFKKLD